MLLDSSLPQRDCMKSERYGAEWRCSEIDKRSISLKVERVFECLIQVAHLSVLWVHLDLFQFVLCFLTASYFHNKENKKTWIDVSYMKLLEDYQSNLHRIEWDVTHWPPMEHLIIFIHTADRSIVCCLLAEASMPRLSISIMSDWEENSERQKWCLKFNRNNNKRSDSTMSAVTMERRINWVSCFAQRSRRNFSLVVVSSRKETPQQSMLNVDLFVVQFSVQIINRIDLRRRLQMALIPKTNWCFNVNHLPQVLANAPREEFKLIFHSFMSTCLLIIPICARIFRVQWNESEFFGYFRLLSAEISLLIFFSFFLSLALSYARTFFPNMHAKTLPSSTRLTF